MTRSSMGRSIRDLTVAGPVTGLDVVPSAVALAGAEVELAPLEGRERRLARLLSDIAADYDYILIDCPPSLGLLTVNALTAADSVLIPLQCEYYALEGLTQLLATLDLIRDNLNPDLEVKGVVLTMYDGRTNLSADVAAEVRRHLGDRVFDAVIPRSVRLSEAPSHGARSPRTRRTRPARSPTPRSRRRCGPATDGSTAPAAVDRQEATVGVVTVRPERSQGLGRGLASLIPQRSPRQPVAIEIRDRADPAEPEPAAQALRSRRSRGAHDEHRGARRPAADPGDRDGRRLPAGRR